MKAKHRKSSRLDAHTVRRISVEALTDPSTTRRYLGGETVRPMSAMRIATALEKLGLRDHVRHEEGIGTAA